MSLHKQLLLEGAVMNIHRANYAAARGKVAHANQHPSRLRASGTKRGDLMNECRTAKRELRAQCVRVHSLLSMLAAERLCVESVQPKTVTKSMMT